MGRRQQVLGARTTTGQNLNSLKMNSNIETKIPVTLVGLPKQDVPLIIKHTGTQCRELTNNFWRWLGVEKSPTIALLPVRFDGMSELECQAECIDYKNIGRVKSAGTTVVIERVEDKKRLSKSHYLMEFETRGEAQAFAKRVRRGKHQTLLVGHRCKRVIMVSSQPDTKLNTVSHLGKAMTKIDVSCYESLPTGSYDDLVKRLALLHKNGNAEDRITPLVIGEVDESDRL